MPGPACIVVVAARVAATRGAWWRRRSPSSGPRQRRAGVSSLLRCHRAARCSEDKAAPEGEWGGDAESVMAEELAESGRFPRLGTCSPCPSSPQRGEATARTSCHHNVLRLSLLCWLRGKGV